MAEQGPYAQSQPWQEQWTRPGLKGLILPPANTPDTLDVTMLLRMGNLQQRLPGPVQIRPGQQRLVTTGGAVHSAGSAADPTTGQVLRVWGVGSSALTGNSGAAGSLASGLSGRPLTFVAFYVENSDDPWLIVADGNRMFKVRVSDGLVLPLGLPAPAAPAAEISDVLSTRFAAFDSSDNTEAANWTATAGYDKSTTPILAGVPTISDVGGVSGSAIQITTDPGGAAVGYASIGGVVITVNAAILQGNPLFPSADDDLVHMWLRIDRPDLVSDVRVYLVCSAGFDPAVVPGQSPTANQDAYVRSFRPNDWTSFVEGDDAATVAGTTIRDNVLKDQFQDDNTPQDGRDIGPGDILATQEISRQTSTQVQAGRGVWSEMGAVGVPLRRGDFARLGTSVDRDWGTLTGLVVVVNTLNASAVQVTLDDFFLTGGFGPDTSDPGAAAYTYKVTNYDPRTGAESNGSEASGDVNPARNRVTVQPAAAADGALHQRAYRFGGTNVTDWNFVGENGSNGGQIIDTSSDLEIVAEDAVPTDHDQPVATVDSSGNTVLNQPCPVIFGPLEDMVFAVGDPYRPGVLYACIPGEIDHWASDIIEAVCPSSEQLLNGVIWGGAGWVFSRDRLYAIYVNLVSGEGQTIRSNPTACTPGMACQYGICATSRGIAYVAADGIRLTQGGPSNLITSDGLSEIFTGAVAIEGVYPIDWSAADQIKLAFADERLWFIYQGTDGSVATLRYDMVSQSWDGPQTFAQRVHALLVEGAIAGSTTVPPKTILGCADGAHLFAGDDDNGAAIDFDLKTGAWDMGLPGPTKSMGDVQVDADLPNSATLRLYAGLNNDIYTDPVLPVGGLTGRRRYLFTPFGIEPQRARNLTTRLTGASASGGAIHLVGASFIPEPLTTSTRPTPWEVFGPGEGYVIGCSILADTGGDPLTVVVDADVAGSVITAATLTVNHNGRRKKFYSWPAVKANQIRLRPTGTCPLWILYDVHYIYQDQPGRYAGWDNANEDLGDTYYTGLDLEADTFGKQKTVEIYVDGVLNTTATVVATGRQVVHISLTPGYGHIYRFVATDQNAGILYAHAWRVETVPGEQTNWNQNFSQYGTNADKYLKALVIRCDTFGQTKTLQIQADGVAAGSVTVNASGPKVVMVSFAQILGRVFRVLPLDGFPGRVWEIEPIFDEEPLCLDRWNTQRIDHGVRGWHSIFAAFPCIRCTADVTLTITSYNQQGAVVQTQAYTIPSTAGGKVKAWVPFEAAKGVLYQWLFTSAASFYLYREESHCEIQIWGGPMVERNPFGTDDMDRIRDRTQGPKILEVPLTPLIPPLK